MIIISTSCITLIDIHYPRVQKYIVYWKGLKLIRRGVDSWAVFLLRPVNKVYSGLQDKEKGSSLGGLFTDYFFWLQGATLLFIYYFAAVDFEWQNRMVLGKPVKYRGHVTLFAIKH